MKLLTLYGLQGSKTLTRLTCYLTKRNNIDVVVLLGDIVSPSIIEWLSKICGVRVFGVDGKLDEYSVITTLKSINGFISGKAVDLGGIIIGGLGISFQGLNFGYREIDILVTYMQGRRYNCGGRGVDTVDHFIDYYKPLVVIMGNSLMPCISKDENIYSPGSARFGHAGILVYDRNEPVFENVNYEYVTIFV